MKRLAALASTALFLLPPTAHADATAAPPIADDPIAMKAIAGRLRQEAADVRRIAADEHAKAQTECWKKFLVSRCLDQAGQALRDEKLKAANLESRARAIERELKRREIAEKDAQRAAKEAAQAGKP
jgi:DNA-directed RNA polymerase alpha subunit